MTPSLDHPLRLHALLDDAVEALRDRATAALLPVLQAPLAGLGLLSAGARGRVVREAAEALDALLDVDLSDVVATAWTRCAALLEAARRTAADGGREVVDLYAHTVEVQHCPAVDVLVDGRKVGVVEAQLDLELSATGAAAVVQAGRLVSIEVGACDVSVVVSVAHVEVARHEGALPYTLELPLGDGLVLVGASSAIPAQHAPGTRVPEGPQGLLGPVVPAG